MKEEFIKIYQENITRPGSDRFLEYLLSDKSDFFTAPCSTRYHGSGSWRHRACRSAPR